MSGNMDTSIHTADAVSEFKNPPYPPLQKGGDCLYFPLYERGAHAFPSPFFKGGIQGGFHNEVRK